MSNDWYTTYTANIRKEAEKVKPAKEISQHTLRLKGIGTEAFKGIEGYGYLRQDDKFYFTELLVNQLMEFAYNDGSKAIEQKSYEAGCYQANKKMAEFIGAEYD